MGLMSRFRHRDEQAEEPCPRCNTPAPLGATDCSACGWDLRESYHEAAPQGRFMASQRDAAEQPQAPAG